VQPVPAPPRDNAPRLHYSSDLQPGISRKRSGRGFRYCHPDGRPVSDKKLLARIKALAIPPAYTEVWISPSAQGHLQATGRDAKGRKQYRYHDLWQAQRRLSNYGQLSRFAQALPRIRRRVARDMAARDLNRDKVAALVVQLLETTLIRIGSREYARLNKSYGLTTLKSRHATLAHGGVRFRFRGKSGVMHDVAVNDRRIVRAVRRCMELPGQELFQYLDQEGETHGLDSNTVNAYLKEASGADFTAKDYRTWAGSLKAFTALQGHAEAGPPDRATVVRVVKEVARALNNTPAVCRACYIHPAIIEAYMAGRLPDKEACRNPRGLRADERRLLAFLARCETIGNTDC